MSVQQQVQELNSRRMRAWEQAKALLDRAVDARRGLTAEEKSQYDKLDSELTRLDKQRDDLLTSDATKREIETLNGEFRRAVQPGAYTAMRQYEEQAWRDFFQGRTQSLTIDLRPASYVSQNYQDGARGADLFQSRAGIFGDTGASGGSLTIPSLVSSQVFAVMSAANVMRQTRMTMITRPDGAPLSIPVGSQGAATQVANEDTTIAGSDPSLASVVLQNYTAGNLVAVSNALIEDAAVNISSWVADNVANAVGTLEETWMVAGTGSNQPTGIMRATATGSAGTVATGGSLILGPAGQVIEKLIDVQYAVRSQYRNVGEWLVNDATAATMRKRRVGAGGTLDAFAWVPSPTAGLIGGTPDTFLGRPIFTSTNVASMASDARVLAFGDFSRYVGREVNGLRLERSADVFFAKDQIAIRGISRIDSNLVDATAVVHLKQSVT